VVLLAAGVTVWVWARWPLLRRQWFCYRVGAARDFREACTHLAWFERAGAGEADRLELVSKWGTGNPRFDLYLARYLGEAACSDQLRAAFARHVGSHPALLERWAHWWAWRAPLDPAEQVSSVLEYHETLLANQPAEPITWREVLDLQAVFALTGQPERARGLAPANWTDHYRVWRETGSAVSDFARPEKPLL